MLAALGEVGYDKYVSVKIYRQVSWDEAASSAMEFLRGRCSARQSLNVQGRSSQLTAPKNTGT